MSAHGWLREHLINEGHLDEKGVGRRVQPRTCRCGASVLVAYHDDIMALEVRADPVALSQLGEVVSLLEGRRTVELAFIGRRYIFDRRDQDHIKSRPAGITPRRDIVREHRCGTDLPTGALTAPSAFSKPKQWATQTEPDF